MNNIVLCGFKHCGKSTVGQALAQAMGMHFMDTDALVVTAYQVHQPQVQCCAEIVRKEGEAYFRRLETRIIADLASVTDHVIALGGGTLMSEANCARLKKFGAIIYLQAEAELLITRILAKGVPAFVQATPSPKAALQALYAQRSPIYAAAADHHVDVNASSVDAIVLTIRGIYGQ